MIIDNNATIEETLRKLISRVTHKRNVVLAPGGTFKELGVDSLEVVQILVAIEDALDIDIADEDLKSIKNMAGFIDYLKKKVNEKYEAKNIRM